MRFHILATDYDGTIAHDGRVDEPTVAALDAVRRSGRTLLLITGRVLPELMTVFPRVDLFDYVVAENGAVLYRPSTRDTRLLAPPPPPRFVAMLRERGVAPLAVGEVIVATWEPHQDVVLKTIRDCGLELQVIFNKGAVMVLPSGVNKATGLAAALAEMKRSARNAVGVGDAENDHAFLAACECSVAVANALPALEEHADWVTEADHGAGVQELARALVDRDLADVAGAAERTALPIGVCEDGRPFTVPAYGPPVLIAGASGSGKSMIATRLLEELCVRGYQFCVVDPEADYTAVDGATVLGDAERAPHVEEALELLETPSQACVVNLLGVPLADRPAFAARLLSRLQGLRTRTGHPHWIVVDEAHALLADDRIAGAVEPVGLLAVTVHPERVSRALLADVRTVLAVGDGAEETLARFAAAAGVEAQPGATAGRRPGDVLAWVRDRPGEVVRVRPAPPRAERRRQARKSTTGDLGDAESFYFRGPTGRLHLRARNLRTFVDLADGVDDDTWRHHLGRGDYSRWFRDAIKDDGLAAEAAAIERDPSLGAAASRRRMREAIARRYGAPE